MELSRGLTANLLCGREHNFTTKKYTDTTFFIDENDTEKQPKAIQLSFDAKCYCYKYLKATVMLPRQDKITAKICLDSSCSSGDVKSRFLVNGSNTIKHGDTISIRISGYASNACHSSDRFLDCGQSFTIKIVDTEKRDRDMNQLFKAGPCSVKPTVDEHNWICLCGFYAGVRQLPQTNAERRQLYMNQNKMVPTTMQECVNNPVICSSSSGFAYPTIHPKQSWEIWVGGKEDGNFRVDYKVEGMDDIPHDTFNPRRQKCIQSIPAAMLNGKVSWDGTLVQIGIRRINDDETLSDPVVINFRTVATESLVDPPPQN